MDQARTSALKFRRYQASDRAGIERLNSRLSSARVPFPVYPEDEVHAEEDRRPIRERLYVAAGGDEVHGAVWLKEHAFWAGDSEVMAGWAKYPVSESLISTRYSAVPAGLIRTLLREQPNLLALGLGGHGGAFARFLAAMGWSGSTISFLFRVVRPGRVLRQLPYVRRGRARRLIMDVLAGSGLAWLGLKVLTGLRSIVNPVRLDEVEVEVIDEFGAWADELWAEHRGRYGFIGIRDSRMLGTLYPPDFQDLTRLRVRRSGEDIGWLCVLRRDQREPPGDRYFGRLAVGLIADGFAAPKDARVVVAAGVRHLLNADVDLIFSNQSHPAWISALKSLHFYEGPSNFAFYRSPQIEQSVGEAIASDGLYLNRGDCDGPRWA